MDRSTLTILLAINDWQRGGDAKRRKRRGLDLKDQYANFPLEFREPGLLFFRQIAPTQGFCVDFDGGG